MCTPAEMIASLGVGAVNFTNFTANTALWVASGVRWDIPGTPATVADDCIGYTSASVTSTTAENGAVFILKPGGANAGIPGKSLCNISNAIACCQ
jgi:hypothetical protein